MIDIAPFAAQDVPDIRGIVFFVMRIVLAGAAAMLTWFVSGPLSSLLYRLAFRRAIPYLLQLVFRLAASVLVCILVFLYLPLGGGSGWGLGPGGGGLGFGSGEGKGEGKGPGKTDNSNPSSDKKEPKDDTKKEPAGKTLRVELILARQLKDDERYYLVDGKEPALSLADLGNLLKSNPGRWNRLELIVYTNSTPQAPHLEPLQNLARTYNLTFAPENLNKRKTSPDSVK